MASAETAHIRQIDAIFGGEGLEPPPTPTGKNRRGLPRDIGTQAIRQLVIPLKPRTLGLLFAETDQTGTYAQTQLRIALPDIPFSLRLTHSAIRGADKRHSLKEKLAIRTRPDPELELLREWDLSEDSLTEVQASIIAAIKLGRGIRPSARLITSYLAPPDLEVPLIEAFEFDGRGNIQPSTETARKKFMNVMSNVAAAVESASLPIASTPPSYGILSRQGEVIKTLDLA